MSSEVKLIKISAPDFSLAMTLNSGQVFHWEKIDGRFVGAIGNEPIYVEQRGKNLHIAVEGGAAAAPGSRELAPPVAELVKHYFALDHPLSEICNSFPDDDAMNAARNFCRGLRIIRQPKWECLATFICSSMKQVAHIRQISLALRRRFGKAREIGGHVAYTFPTPEQIAESSEDELQRCALGYRAKNLLATAVLVSSGEADLDHWGRFSDTELRAKLCALPGVGAKVANCVMLFAYERLSAFPIDVWIARALKQRYFPRKRNITAGQLRRFSETYFGEHGGYAQQYLFHYMRSTWRKSAAPRDSSRLRSPKRSTTRQANALRCVRNDKMEVGTKSRKSAVPALSS